MATPKRLAPNVVTRHRSPNSSARTAPISLIVLHSTESHNIPGSSADLESIAGFFDSSSSQVSSHVVVDGDGNSARCVADDLKAWACVAYNSASLNIEQIGSASQSRWDRPEWVEAARWIAQWSHEYGVPIRRAITRNGAVLRSGVTTHKALGVAGGGHVDPGAGYPLGKVLRMARRIKKLRYEGAGS